MLDSKLLELVNIVETPLDYQDSLVDVAHEALQLDGFPHEEAKLLATDIVRAKCAEIMKGFAPLTDKLQPPESHFLSKEEVLEVLKSVFTEFMSRREAMSVDVWSYAIGGG